MIRSVSTKASFRLALKKPKCVVDFWAPWCSPCLKMKPVVSKVSGDFADRAEFIEVDIDEAGDFDQKVASIPTIVVYRNGEEHDRLVGGVSERELRKWLTAALED